MSHRRGLSLRLMPPPSAQDADTSPARLGRKDEHHVGRDYAALSYFLRALRAA